MGIGHGIRDIINRTDKDLRFCAVNMVILDNIDEEDQEDMALQQGKDKIVDVIQQTDDWITDCTKIIK